MRYVISPQEKQLIDTIRPTIKNKQLIRFWYEDKTDKEFKDWRHVEPHLIGKSKYQPYNIMLVAWFLPTQQQIWEGHQEEWGQYILGRISKIEILDQHYLYPRPGYNSNDQRMTQIYCSVR